MSTYFDQLSSNVQVLENGAKKPAVRSFVDVPVTDKGVDTDAFIEAARGLAGIFGSSCPLLLPLPLQITELNSTVRMRFVDVLGSAAFTMVQSDLNGNIKKINDRRHPKADDPTFTAPETDTIEQLLASEKAEGKTTATEGLLWLLRAMNFTCKALQDNSAQLSESFTKSYTNTLRPFHNFVTGGIFRTAMLACPTRETFVTKLGTPKEKVEEQSKAWLDALDAILKRLMAFFIAGKYFKVKDDAFGKVTA
ncbi:hypothetical protein BOTBODRAFT_180489 [Botryobasidium botryosum FD-172 SS1]|uniref:Glycolipid transfer protein domain-containing protein n=1 Tax=Botryobasidium botryosum (strain FD-172 SS1) TaxID=930990 RepID=A0A067LWY6_BOTB1|nr:hypothetical protein BOTBODRAFT_180489 [Botryobasidium botryosum FD-172 SS1]